METSRCSTEMSPGTEHQETHSIDQQLLGALPLKSTPGKRKRRRSDETYPSKVHGSKIGHRPATKKAKLHSQMFAMSSTKAANNVMKFRLGGSVSDPLNLSGAVDLGDDCSTCAPSPVSAEVFGQASPLPPQLQHDPLNLEGKLKNFPTANKHGAINKLVAGCPSDGHSKVAHGHKKKTHPRRRTISKSEGERKGQEKHVRKESRFSYGNYDRYYGYRNSGIDLRLSLLKKEWFEGKDCLDIGCNTGQVTMKIASEMKPRKIVGIDIDSKLIKMAWKNLHRESIPALAPDGRRFPLSLTLTRGPISIPEPTSEDITQQERQFPHNVQFVEGNYVPQSDSSVSSQDPEYDVILALSVTKWIHLNWGDIGIKRFFKRVYHHLRPGGKFIVEPQPHSSYAKKKKLNSTIFANFQRIEFYPHHFHDYLMSEEVGFAQHKFLGVPENKNKGFRRPLHMYIKPDMCHAVAQPQMEVGTSDNSSDTDEEFLTTKQLKSVVVEPPKSVPIKDLVRKTESDGISAEHSTMPFNHSNDDKSDEQQN